MTTVVYLFTIGTVSAVVGFVVSSLVGRRLDARTRRLTAYEIATELSRWHTRLVDVMDENTPAAVVDLVAYGMAERIVELTRP